MVMIMTRSGFSRGLALAAAIAAAVPAWGQTDGDVVRRLERQLRQLDATYRLAVPAGQPIAERLMLDYGGSIRFGLLGVDAPCGETRILRQTDGVLYLRAELDGAHRFFGRLRFLYNDFNDHDSFDGRGDEWEEPIGDRYWYQFDLRGAKLAETGQRSDYNVNIKAGRQFVYWGSGLTLNNVLYAGLLDAELADFGFTGLLGLTPSSGTIDWDASRPGFDSDTDRAYFGGQIEYRGFATHRPYFFALVQRDHNERDEHTFRTPIFNYPTEFKYNSEYWALGSRGSLGPNLYYRAELVYETGEGLSSPFDRNTAAPVAQTREDIEAWAGVFKLTYLLRDDFDTRFDLELVGGSGDDDRLDSSDTFGGNESGTDDNAFNSLGYINTGLALAPDVSNLFSIRLGASTSPHQIGTHADWLRLGVNGFLFFKIDKDAPLNVRTSSETFIGGEIDFAVDWRITSDLSATLRYGLFLPGDAIPGCQDDPRHFAYAGVTYAF
jgi:hypothetical protein